MKFIHTKCGGYIDVKTRTCTKCKKKWNWLTWMITATEIRPIAEIPTQKVGDRVVRLGHTRKQYASWADRLHGVGAIASRLPNWPRWTRILVTATFVGVIAFLLWWFLW